MTKMYYKVQFTTFQFNHSKIYNLYINISQIQCYLNQISDILKNICCQLVHEEFSICCPTQSQAPTTFVSIGWLEAGD